MTLMTRAARPRTLLLAITLGDPAGIGPEITLKALARLRLRRARLIGSRPVIEHEAQKLGFALPAGMTIDDTGPVGRFRPGRADPRCGAAALAALERGVDLLRQGGIRALVTAPVSKTALRLVGFRWPGQTEFLAERLSAKRTAMLAWTPRFKVIFVTIHRPLAEVSRFITAAAVAEKTALLDEFLSAELGRRPHIGVMAFNPHGEEFSRGEEARIAAGVSRARELGIAACGPFPADALAARPGEYDGYVAMYHDQAMIPAKLLGPGVNVTLGLGAVRTSPLHGTAFDSAALNYVLHCLPGPQSHKAVAIRNVAAVLAPDGVLFGGTVLGNPAEHTLLARASLSALNRRGVFDNLADTERGLRQILQESFQTIEIDVVGSVAHFTATRPH